MRSRRISALFESANKKLFNDRRFKQTKCGSLCSLVDQFNKAHSQRMDGGGSRKLASLVGILLSLIFFVVVTSYALQKLEVLIWKKDNEIMMTELRYFYGDDEAFTGQEGFDLAFGLTTEDGSEIDATYGFFYLTEEEWGHDEDGLSFFDFEPVPFHSCRPGEIDKDFYPIVDG